MKTIWQVLISLVNHRRNIRRLREEEQELDMERQLLEFGMWMSLLSEAKAAKEK